MATLALGSRPSFVDEAAQVVVPADINNNAADSERLPVLLVAVKANLDQDALQVLTDAGFRSEAVFEQRKDSPSEWSERWGARASRR